MPEDTKLPLQRERRSHLPTHIPLEHKAIGEYFDSLSPTEQREFAIGLALGNAALSEAVAKDSKTGLLVSAAFRGRVISETSYIDPESSEAVVHGLIIGDIDDFKALNTVLGYQETDDLALIPAAHAIRDNIRSEQDIVARFGGEEFLVFLPNTEPDGIALVARKLQKAVNAIEPSTGKKLGFSIGWATFPQGAEYEDIFKAANDALLEAKKIEGKNGILQAEI